ncbi:MAG: hypothetical protein HY717_14435 [Planctomycetes bacterium]|nr:hypothetical protein [Planctomycetota bacterium]
MPLARKIPQTIRIAIAIAVPWFFLLPTSPLRPPPVLGEEPEKKESLLIDVSGLVSPPPQASFVLEPYGPLIFWSGDDIGKPRGFAFGPDRDSGGAETCERSDPGALVGLENLFQILTDLRNGRRADSQAEKPAGPELSVQGGRIRAEGTAEEVRWVRSVLQPAVEEAETSLQVECLLASPEALEAARPGWRDQGIYFEAEVFEKLLSDPRSRLLRASGRSGQRLEAGSEEVFSFLNDYEVSQAGVIPVINPVLSSFPAGERLEALPVWPDRDGPVWLDIALGSYRVKAESWYLGCDLGTVELPVVDELLLSTVVSAPAGQAILLGEISRASNGEPAAILLQVKASPAGESRSEEKKPAGLRFYDLSLLFSRPGGKIWPGPGSRKLFSDERAFPWNADDFEERFRARAPEVWGKKENRLWARGRCLAVYGSEEAHRTVKKFLQDEMSRSFPMAMAALTGLKLPRDQYLKLRALEEAGGWLKPGWSEGIKPAGDQMLWRCSVAGVPGEFLGLRQVKLQGFIAHFELVAGGTGFAVVEIPDAVATTCGEGLDFRQAWDRSGGQDLVRWRLLGADAALKEMRDLKATVPTQQVLEEGGTRLQRGQSHAHAGSARLAETVQDLNLQAPHQQVRSWRLERFLQAGRDAILSAEIDREGVASVLIGRLDPAPAGR